MKRLGFLFTIITALIIGVNSCKKARLNKYEERILGVWNAADVSGDILKVGDQPVWVRTFYEDHTFHEIQYYFGNTADLETTGVWEIRTKNKKKTDELVLTYDSLFINTIDRIIRFKKDSHTLGDPKNIYSSQGWEK